MNPQPTPFVGQLLALMVIVYAIYHFVKAFNDPNCHIDMSHLDYFKMGYVENSPVYLIDNTKKNNFASTQLFKDCVSALSALGSKKTEAKKIATQIFTNHDPQPQSVQDFLMIALRNP